MDYDKLKVAELKAECQRLGLSVGGLKKELADRLKEAAASAGGAGAAVAAPAAAPTIAEQHAFLDAAKTFSFATVKQLVLDNPAYANCQPSGRWTALHQAGLAGDAEMVKFLIARGADLKCTTTDGRTPWDVAKAECKALLEPPGGGKGKAGGKQKAAVQSGPPPKSQKVSMKGSTAQVRYGGTGPKSGGQVQQVVKGRAAADASCPHADEMHVYYEGDDVYDALLNQADIGENKNKYYILQLMESDASPHQYYTWNRWGRVGEERALQNAWRGPMSLAAAKADHCKKFHDKTKNEWHARDSFAPKSGKYTLLARDYGTESAAAPAAAAPAESGASKAVESQLDGRVQSFVSLIADVKMMERQMLEIGFDSEKMPLGKLKKATILQAYAALKELSELLVGPDAGGGGGSSGGGGGSSGGGGGSSGGGGGKSKSKSKSLAGGGVHDTGEVQRLSNMFYSLIPHTTEKRQVLQLIDTPQRLKEKIELVEALGNIEMAARVIDTGKGSGFDVHPVDLRYRQLGSELTPVERGGELHVLLERYLQKTHASTHSTYTLELQQAFEVEREGEAAAFRDVGNRQLLWHGSRLTNWCGILSQGLRIAPPEAPATGYMFGKGVYFADCSSKSANYCFANKQSSVGILLLSEVSLGGAYERLAAEYEAAPACRKAGKQHTWGKGKAAPKEDEAMTLPGDPGLKVPIGPVVPTGVASSLLYNEFIVYDISQIKQRFVLQVKFHY